MTARIWSGVSVSVQSALGAAQAVSGITKANPGVVTYADADPSNGNYVLLANVQGMTQLKDRLFRVANVNSGGNTLELEGEDTTNYSTFSSGNLHVVTLGTSLTSAVDVSVSGGEFEEVDTTTIHDDLRSVALGVASNIVLDFSCQWDPGDEALKAFVAASKLKASRAVMIAFADASRVLFYGRIGATLVPTGSAQQLVATNVRITGTGAPTLYTS